jgi:hypothetical protein
MHYAGETHPEQHEEAKVRPRAAPRCRFSLAVVLLLLLLVLAMQRLNVLGF